jgi:hypothetical protein
MPERLVDEARGCIALDKEELVPTGPDNGPPHPTNQTFGQRVRRLRREQGYSQQELAGMAEITRATSATSQATGNALRARSRGTSGRLSAWIILRLTIERSVSAWSEQVRIGLAHKLSGV